LKRIFVTGALGQIGSELVDKLRNLYGEDNVLSTDIREPNDMSGPFEILDVSDGKKMYELAKQFNADTFIHLAALLSATAEKNPLFAWNLNMGGLMNALEVSRELNLIFHPKFHWRFWTYNTERQHATRYFAKTDDNVWSK